MGIGTLLGRRTGEAFTMSFAGKGFVVVQASEEPPPGMGDGQQQSGPLGGLFGN